MPANEIIPAGNIAAADWDRVVRHAPLGQFWNLAEWRLYSKAFAGLSGEDDSFAVQRNGRLDAVCSLIWEGQSYTMGGEAGPMPAAWSEFGLTEALDEAVRRARARSVPLTFRLPVYRTLNPTERDLVQARGWIDGGWETRIVPLTSAAPVLWRGVRKSYHSLIHRTEGSHRLVLSCGDALAQDYMRLHQDTVGTIMRRPGLTYDLQASWLRTDQAMLVGAQDRSTNEWDGFAYVFLHHDTAYYGSGPSRPGKTVMHGLQWATLRACQARGLRYYEIGWQGHAQDDDDKGKGIEMFKRGFGGMNLPLGTWSHD